MWYRLVEQTDFVLPRDMRSTSQILRDSISGNVHLADSGALFMRINGIVGGMLSRQGRAQTEAQALAVLEHRFESDSELKTMLNQPDFRLYLKRKASERIAHLNIDS
jgi:hypothetical protein